MIRAKVNQDVLNEALQDDNLEGAVDIDRLDSETIRELNDVYQNIEPTREEMQAMLADLNKQNKKGVKK